MKKNKPDLRPHDRVQTAIIVTGVIICAVLLASAPLAWKANAAHYIYANSNACEGESFESDLDNLYEDQLDPYRTVTSRENGKRDFSIVAYRKNNDICVFAQKEERFTGRSWLKNTFGSERYTAEPLSIKCVSGEAEVADDGSYVHLAGPVVIELNDATHCTSEYDGRTLHLTLS